MGVFSLPVRWLMANDGCLLSASEMTDGQRLLGNLRLVTGHCKEQGLLEDRDFQPHSSHLQGEKGWRLNRSSMASDTINDSYIMKTSLKKKKGPKDNVWGASWLLTMEVLGSGVPRRFMPFLPYLALWSPSIRLFICPLCNSLYNKSGTANKVLP
jgi:hypothetical protein